MSKTIVFDAFNKPTQNDKQEIVNFLHHHLQEYGDPKKHIMKAIDYSVKDFGPFGGFTMVLKIDEKIVGAVVVNRTGMSGYIPENILVYIATHEDYRGKGLGSQLFEKAIKYCKGDVALHVEADNPAKKLYEKFGFTNPYLEMRLRR